MSHFSVPRCCFKLSSCRIFRCICCYFSLCQKLFRLLAIRASGQLRSTGPNLILLARIHGDLIQGSVMLKFHRKIMLAFSIRMISYSLSSWVWVPVCFKNHWETRQIWGIWKLRPAYSPETPNLGQNRSCFVPCDLEIGWMTLENNRASLLCCFKLCASFLSHWWIQTWVTVWKRPIWVKFDDF